MLNSNPQYQYALLGANTTTQVKGNSGLVGSFIPSASGNLALYDNTSGNTTVNTGNPQILVTTAVIAGTPLPIPAKFVNGLVAITSGGAAGTILFN